MSLRLCCILLSLGCPRGCAALSPSCPAGCCCPHPDALVFCESLGLTSLPRFIPRNTSVLSVARNLLCNMDHLLQNFSSLQVLNLSHNHLDRFPRGLPPSLESLQLQENRITYITTRALKQLRKLVQLDLEDNRIRAMQPRALLTLSRLERLSLKGNFLSSLPLFLPPSLTHLDVLKINRNCLQSVPEAAFDGLSRLHFVDLANNLWTCECDIMYLYRWLLDGRLGLAGDLVCAAPLHLAHRLLLTLSVMAICPRVLKQNEEAPPLNSTLPTSLRNSPAVETKFSVRLSIHVFYYIPIFS
uniref:LRRCT domain-containing protein n=1 Tax=Denticeps clupeoides TaxID=299321 RepID=A0AAY4CKE4_9TELE